MKSSSMRRTGIIWYLGIFILSLMLYIAVIAIEGAYPFGDRCFLADDAYVQYNTMLRTLIEYVHSGDGGTILWNRGLGTDMYLNALYYLLSPFNLIAVVLGENHVELTLIIIIVLKCSLIPVSGMYYFAHTEMGSAQGINGDTGIPERLKTWVMLCCALAFGFCGYIVAYGQNIIWLDALILMPIIAIFVERVNRGYGQMGYAVLLAITLAVNFYYAFYICMFIVVYYIILDRDSIKAFIGKGIVLAGLSLLAAAMSAVVLIPAAMCVLRAGDTSLGSWDVLSMWGDPGDYAVSFFPFKEVTSGYMFNNNNFCGTIAVLMLCVYIFSSNVSAKNKVKYVSVAALFVLAANSLPLNYVLHGFVVTHGTGNRFAVILTFVMIVITYRMLTGAGSIRTRNVICGAILSLGIFALSFTGDSRMQAPYSYIVFLFLLVISVILLVLASRKSISTAVAVGIISVIWFIEVCCNVLIVMPGKAGDESLADRICLGKWEDEYDLLHVEDGQRRTALVYEDYTPDSDVNWYSSMINGYFADAFSSMGLAHFDNVECVYDGTTPLTSMMYNVRYVLSASKNTNGGYHEISSNDLYSIYEADSLAGMGFMAGEELAGWTNCSDVAANQSSFVKLGYGSCESDLKDTPVMKPVAWKSLEDSMYDIKESYNLGDFEKTGIGEYIYTSNSVYPASVHLDFTASEDMELYVYSQDTRDQAVMVYVDGELSSESMYYTSGQLVYGGHVNKGQKVKVAAFGGASAGETAKKKIQLYSFDNGLFDRVRPYITDEVLVSDGYEANTFKGHITAQKDGVLYMAFPYSDGYDIYVDGHKTKKLLLGKGNMGVRLSEGYHDIELTYYTPGRMAGLIVSICAIALWVILYIRSFTGKK